MKRKSLAKTLYTKIFLLSSFQQENWNSVHKIVKFDKYSFMSVSMEIKEGLDDVMFIVTRSKLCKSHSSFDWFICIHIAPRYLEKRYESTSPLVMSKTTGYIGLRGFSSGQPV